MADIQGFNAKVSINGIVYRCVRFTITDEVQDEDVTNFEDSANGFGDQVDCIERATVRLEKASFDPLDNPFLVPQALVPRAIVQLKIWPNTRAGPLPWTFSRAQVLTLEHTGEATRLQPITMTLKTKLTYNRPYGS